MLPTTAPPLRRPTHHHDAHQYQTVKHAAVERLRQLGTAGDVEHLYRDYTPSKPRQRKKERLTEKIAMGLTPTERTNLERSLAILKDRGQKVSLSYLVMNAALKPPPFAEWAAVVEKVLPELNYLRSRQNELEGKVKRLRKDAESLGDHNAKQLLLKEANEIVRKLDRIKGRPQGRTKELSGYMRWRDAQLVRTRANRLKITDADYLRFLLFAKRPDSDGDAHMSFERRVAFYGAILVFAEKPDLFMAPVHELNCQNCYDREEENRQLREEIRQLRSRLSARIAPY